MPLGLSAPKALKLSLNTLELETDFLISSAISSRLVPEVAVTYDTGMIAIDKVASVQVQTQRDNP